MKPPDHYSVLGVLPNAEDIVITAAFRALAQRYHPDKWKGNPAEAHERMTEINAAYAVLGESERRTEYDNSLNQGTGQEFSPDSEASQSEAFSSALDGIEERWSIACSIYPDLRSLRLGLSKISTALAFAFVTSLLEAKVYERRVEVANKLEQSFLRLYFGSNSEILKFARGLIFAGHRAQQKL